MEIYKESLRGQYGLGCIIFWRLLKVLWKDNMDQTVLSFMYFSAVAQFRKLVIARFKGQCGSSSDDTVHSVLVDNLVHKDKLGWNIETILAR